MDDERPPRLNVAGADGEPPGERPPARRRHAHAIPAVIGILAGAAAIATAVVLLTGGSDPPPAPSEPATSAEPELPVLRIVFPEGFTRKEMAERITEVGEIAQDKRGVTPALTAKDYLSATVRKQLDAARAKLPPAFADDSKVKGFEGFLFPATYDFNERTVAPELVADQLEAFGRAWSQVDLDYAKKRNLTAYDVLIIASMVEGEVQVPKERALVAAVIYNRLKLRMPLGIDATIRYGLDIPPDRAIRQSELDDPNPYNTRIHAGLPPTPIGNPGLAALQAAAHPADVDYLYFVRTKDCKSHFFTESEEEFLRKLEEPRC
ncbi:MAG: endolytic transglycosylase MltG [Thermoleophilia bacterium]|nr:endolytic transglycosylase MltG [Thermoleophilia bacterium]